jgi:hypothetical protein
MRLLFALVVVLATFNMAHNAPAGLKADRLKAKVDVNLAGGHIDAQLKAPGDMLSANNVQLQNNGAKLNAGVQAKLRASPNQLKANMLKGGYGYDSYGYDSYGYNSYCDPYDSYCDSYESYSYCDPYDSYCDSYSYESYESYCDPHYDSYCDSYSYEYYKR